MRLVHLADLHLGYRQYQRLTPAGINQREEDVARSFQRAIDKTIELAPDVVVFAGDIFHSVRPSNPAILHAFYQLSNLTRELPDAAVVMIAGNHDTPRSAETGCILQLFSRIGIAVVDRDAQRLSFPAHNLSVLAVPAMAERPSFDVDPDYKYNVLLLHGTIPEAVPETIVDRASQEYTLAELKLSKWSYTALGDHHVHRNVGPNAYYAGSIDYTSVNTWGDKKQEELGDVPGKGIVEHDLDSGAHRFHPLPASRPLIDLTSISARGLTAAEIDERIRKAVDDVDGGIDDKIVRLRIFDLPRHVARDLDHRAIREYKRRALYFHLDGRRPELVQRRSASGAPRRRLHDLVREHLTHRIIDADLDRTSLVELGIEYLERAPVVSSVGTAAAEV